MNKRKRAALLILLIAAVAAGYVAIPIEDTPLSPVAPRESSQHPLVRWIASLSHIELLHIVTHLTLFGLVAFLVGPWGAGSSDLAWRYVVMGCAMIEGTQIAVGWSDDTFWSLTRSTTFDLLVNTIGGWAGIQAALRFQKTAFSHQESAFSKINTRFNRQ